MKKLSNLLNKALKRTFDSSCLEKQLASQYEKEWIKQGQKVVLKSELDFIKASVIFQSIDNKFKLENAYILVRDGLNEFWNTLDYTERKRIVNIDMQKTLESMPSFYSKKWGCDVYISFLDERLNELYRSEMVMFELRQYNKLTLQYKDFIVDNGVFDYDVYNGTFVPTLYLNSEGNKVVLYNKTLSKFYVVDGETVYSFPLLDGAAKNRIVTTEILMPLADLLLKENVIEFMKMAKSFGLFSENFCEDILRKYSKKSFFF